MKMEFVTKTIKMIMITMKVMNERPMKTMIMTKVMWLKLKVERCLQL